ncbi:MAG: hypothetical protein R2734_18375 [Nocardioides sp.]
MAERLPTPDDLAWEDRVAEFELNALDRLRAHADKWRNGLIALTGVVATATAVTAPFVGTHLQDDPKIAMGVVALVAVLALGIGSAAAMRAAFGQPSSIDNTGTALRDWTEAEVKTSACWLRVAQVTTLIGFTALVIAAGIGFTQAEDPPTLVVVTPRTGPEVCGSATWAGDKLTVTAGDGTRHPFQTAALTKVDEATKC